jgi:hypothetical protein
MFNTPWGIPIKITPNCPLSVPLNQDFEYNVMVENQGQTPLTVRIYQVMRKQHDAYASQKYQLAVSYDTSKTIAPHSQETFSILIPGFDETTFDASVSLELGVGGQTPTYKQDIIAKINTYDPHDETACGGRHYTKGDAICKEGILYPVYPGKACLQNSDCASSGVCIDYACIQYYSILNPDRAYSVGIVPVFIYDDETWLQEKNKRESELQQLAQRTTQWFADERVFQEAASNFEVGYRYYMSCSLSKAEYLETLKTCNDLRSCDKEILANCGVDFFKYDIVAETYYYQPNVDYTQLYPEWRRIGVVGVAGINFGDFLSFGLSDEKGIKDMGALIHETLHSFGVFDLYTSDGWANSPYQQRDCNLFRANWAGFKKTPHLCDLEAKLIGWKS